MFKLLITRCMFLLAISATGNGEPGKPVANGREPSAAATRDGYIYLAWGSGDSVFFSRTKTDAAFAGHELVAKLPALALGAGRGPQVATTADGPVVICTDKPGNIYTFKKAGNTWQKSRLNDVPDIAKEGFLSVSGDGKQKLFAVWLDLRTDHHNKIYGASSENGGRTWSRNLLIYRSPDGTVCECCKPSLAVNNNQVTVMFRNWLHGSRDLYLITSSDGGNHFGNAVRLGKNNWELNGCPMDGGGVAVNNNGSVETVWRRKNTIYTCVPGEPEKAVDEGKSCGIAGQNGKNFIVYVKEGNIICNDPSGKKNVLGKGMLPRIISTGEHEALVVWEENKKIYSTLVKG